MEQQENQNRNCVNAVSNRDAFAARWNQLLQHATYRRWPSRFKFKMTWLTTAYMLTSRQFFTIAGKLADVLLSRRNVYHNRASYFHDWFALCGYGEWIMPELIISCISIWWQYLWWPMSMIIIGDMFTGKRTCEMARYFGCVIRSAAVIGRKVVWMVDAVQTGDGYSTLTYRFGILSKQSLLQWD